MRVPSSAPIGTSAGAAAGEDSDVVVRVEHLSKTFGGVRAVDDVSFTVYRGQLVTMLGRSGAGKSTILRMLNGLATPTSGSVNVLGRSPAELTPRQLRRLRRQIAFVFQQFNIVHRLSALENVLTGALGRITGPRYGVAMYPKALRVAAMEQLSRVGLESVAFQRAATLSGGQQQRVAIARALFQKPELIVADEPVASLDPEAAEQVMDILVKCCVEDRLTVICSLHQLEYATNWAERAIGLRQGRLVMDSPLADLSQAQLRGLYSDGTAATGASSRAEPSNAGAAISEVSG